MGFCEVFAELNRILTEMSLPNFTTIKESTERMDKNQRAVRDGDAERSGSRKVGKCSFNAHREGRPHSQLRVLSEFPSL